MNNKLILFDLDGTLTESGPGIKKSIAYGLEKVGRKIPSDEMLASFIGPPILAQLRLLYNMDDEEAMKVLFYYRKRYNSVGAFESRVYPEIPGLLEKLKDSGYLLGMATAKPHKTAEMILGHYGLMKYMDFYQGAVSEDEKSDKVNVINLVLEKAGFSDRRNCVCLVGDRKYDATGAKLTGIAFIGAGWGYAPRGELGSYDNIGIASSPKEVYEIITRKATPVLARGVI